VNFLIAIERDGIDKDKRRTGCATRVSSSFKKTRINGTVQTISLNTELAKPRNFQRKVVILVWQNQIDTILKLKAANHILHLITIQ